MRARHLLLVFQHQHDRTAGADKSITAGVEGPRREVRIRLQRKRAHASEREDGVDVSVLRSDDEHPLLAPENDVIERVANRVRR